MATRSSFSRSRSRSASTEHRSRTPKAVSPVHPHQSAADSQNVLQKRQLVWPLAVGAFVIVFFIWIAANPFDSRPSKRTGFGAIGAGLSNLWTSLRELGGAFHEPQEQPQEITNEYIQELEQRVFPQFENVNNGQNQ